MACISLGIIDKNLITIILSCVFCFLNRLVNKTKDTLLFKNATLTVVCILIPKFLVGILLIIFIFKTKQLHLSDKKIINKNTYSFLSNRDEENANKGKWLYLILTTIILYAYLFLLVFAFEIKTNSWICYIMIVSIFSYLFFKTQLYKHHYLSIIAILFLGLIIDLVTENLQIEIVNNTIKLLLKFIKEILLSLYCVMAKYVMEKNYVSIYEFSFYMGLFGLIISGIVAILDYYILEFGNYDEYFSNFSTKELLVMLGIIATQFGLNLTMLFIIRNNSPCHVFIMFVFGQIAYYLDFEGYAIIVIICLILILFLSLIFNEFIEINIFGLSFNTRKNIINRALAEEDSYGKMEETTNRVIINDEYLIELADTGLILITN